MPTRILLAKPRIDRMLSSNNTLTCVQAPLCLLLHLLVDAVMRMWPRPGDIILITTVQTRASWDEVLARCRQQ